jgi:hypothetical protein
MSRFHLCCKNEGKKKTITNTKTNTKTNYYEVGKTKAKKNPETLSSPATKEKPAIRG